MDALSKKKKKIGREAIDPDKKRVQYTVTISPEASRIVEAGILEETKPYHNNKSAFIESCIVGK